MTPRERALDILWCVRGGAYSDVLELVKNRPQWALLLNEIIRGIEADRAGHQRTGPGIGDAVRV
jgi:hypothetical protein